MIHTRTLLACVLVCLLADEAVAGRWKVRGFKGVDLNTTYSSNVFLEGANTQQDTIVSLRPRISITRRGGRGRVSINYAPELLFYVQGSQSPQIVNFLNANANVILIDRLFGISANARAGQSIINPDQPFTQVGYTNPNNITNTYGVSITPYLLPIRLGVYAIFNLDINYSVVLNSSSEVQDSRGRNANVGLRSGPYFTKLTWSLSSQQTLTSYQDTNSDDIFANLTATVNYRFNRWWQLNSWFGYDDNSVNTTRDINGGFWRLGATYTPISRASFTFGMGERYNSTDYYLNAFYRHRVTRWFANYSRSLQTARDEFLNRRLFSDTDVFGDPVADPTLERATYEVFPGAPLNDTVYIADAFNMGMNWSRRRTSFSLYAGYTLRDDLQIDSITRDWNLGINLGRRLSPRSSANLYGNWFYHIDDTDADNDYQQWSGGISYSYRMSQYTNLRMGYWFTIRDASSGDDFGEDSLGISFVTNYD